jgi:hypothetical protein
MRGAVPQLPQYTLMAWCSVKEKRRGLLLTCDLVQGGGLRGRNFAMIILMKTVTQKG